MLSWIRASAQFLFIGIGFFQYLKLDNVHLDLNSSEEDLVMRLVRPVGALCIIIAAVILVFGMVRHYRVQLYLSKNWFPAAKFTIGLLLVGCLVMGIVVATLEVKLMTR